MTFKNSLEGKILGITGAVIIISFIIAFTINAWTEIKSIERESREKSHLIGDVIESSIRTIMLTGNNDIASMWVDDLRAVSRLKELYVLKTNGMLAFRDLDTIRKVNRKLGKELFKREALEGVRIMDEKDSRLLKVLNDQKELEYIRKEAEGHTFVQIKPVFNGIKCAKCHTKEKDILGIMKVTTSMVEVDRGVKKIVLTALGGIILSSLLVTILLLFLLRLLVTRPISKVAETIKGIIKDNKLDNMVSYESKDEIGSLVEDFNVMMGRLNDLYTTLEEKVKERTRQLIQAEKIASVGQLATGIVHEIRNPLSGIKLSIQLIEKEINGALDKDIRDVFLEIQRIERLLDRLLGFARPHAPVMFPVNLNEVIEKTISLTRVKAKHAMVEIETSLKRPLPNVQADSDLMQQVFLNLILNAIKAMPGGGRLKISTGTSDGDVEVSFSDTGLGIPKEYMDKIFDPFFTTRGASGGSGLGLSISYRIVHEHKGELKVKSTEGKGTTFTIRLKAFKQGG